MIVSVDIPEAALTVAAPRPAWVSQSTVEAYAGIGRRPYLEIVVPSLRARGVEVASVGRLRLVRCADLDAWLASQTGDRAETGPAEDTDAAIAERLGLRAVGGSR